MKKIMALLLALAMSLGVLTACGEDTEGTTAPTRDTAPSETTEPEAEGAVRLLNLDPDMEDTWLSLAEKYMEQNDVTVEVTTADRLPTDLDEEEGPTLLFGTAGDLAGREGELLDLTGASVYYEMRDQSLVLTDESGKVKALAAGSETFGLLVNRTLLEQAGHTLEAIGDLASLKFTAEDIHSRTEELGFDAFTAAGLDEKTTPHLLNVPLYYESRDGGTYLMALRHIWDLQLQNSTGESKGLEAFREGKAVFCLGGSWDLEALLGEDGLDPESLAMIPVYCGVDGEMNAGLSSAADYWAVNGFATQEDARATLYFLYWAVTSQEGMEILSGAYSGLPYKGDLREENPFLADAKEYGALGNYNVEWVFDQVPDRESWQEAVSDALEVYAAGPTDENWAAVEAAYNQK